MSEQSGHDQSSPRTRLSRRVHVGLVVVGILAVGTGLLLYFLPSSSPTIGWFAYQPLSETAFLPSTAFLDPLKQAGIVVGIGGVLLLAFAAGWAFGRQEASNRQPILE
ncbi:hypothetical protein GCM10022381_03440 [Leifsonia kafniensis]|uniref:Uncharacterized protein n=1 Tax=Leifsonia kafniensis TaxID=475957 RepID=A0ABP7K1P5_9MICO